VPGKRSALRYGLSGGGIVVAVLIGLAAAGALSSGGSRPSATGTHQVAKPAAGAVAVHGSPGWSPKTTDYFGLYRLTWSNNPALAQSGQLTLFMRRVTKPKPQTLPSGVISLHGRDGTNVFYLTHLNHVGNRNGAVVNIGNYNYQVAGHLQILDLALSHHRLRASLATDHGPTIDISFSRYSPAFNP
jgi:hypothetical protein